MNSWPDASSSDLELYCAISSVLGYRVHLLNGLFQKDFPRLSCDSIKLKKHYRRCLSEDEFVLIKTSLDIWDRSGGARVKEIIDLDERTFTQVINGLLLAKQSQSLNPSF